MARVVLFDIDGTLITSGGAGARALTRCVAQAHGLDEVVSDFSFAGMTDPAIFRGLLRGIGADASDAAIDRLLGIYPEVLREEVAGAAGFRAHSGIVEGLDALAGRDGVALGLGTGNIERGARIKLERVDLNHYFSFGGYGSDSEARDALLRSGAERGARCLGRPLSTCEILVVGDTPRDVDAAHTIGAPCLAVATGGATADTLRDAGADWVFEDLRAPGALDVLRGS